MRATTSNRCPGFGMRSARQHQRQRFVLLQRAAAVVVAAAPVVAALAVTAAHDIGLKAEASAGATWHGPQVNVTHAGGRPMISVAGAHEPLLWFVGHGDLTNATARGCVEIAECFTQVNASTRAGFNLVEILVDQWERADTRSGVSNRTAQSIDGILALNPGAMIILRPSILPAVEPSVVMCKGNSSATAPSSLTTPASTRWLSAAKAGLLPFIKAVDAAYPGHIAGVHLTGMSTGEWMWPGAGSTGDPPNASATCDGTGGGQINGYADYSEPMRVAFCASSNHSRGSSGSSGCALATPAERDLPRTGNSFVCGGREAAAAAAAVVRQNLLLAQVMADAIGGLAQAVKEATGHKALVLTFFGYVLHYTTDRLGSNSRNLVNSGHLAGSSLLANPAIDGFVGTYSYSPNTRNLSMPLLPAGEYSSLWKRGKLWIIEDDTRTHLCPSDQVYDGWPLKWCHSLGDTKSILRRNYLSASMLSHGSYLFDLEAQGWFGQAHDPATADAMWQTMAAAVKAVAKVDLESGPLPSHQVAVFFDEASAATQPLDSRLIDTHNASSRTISGDYATQQLARARRHRSILRALLPDRSTDAGRVEPSLRGLSECVCTVRGATHSHREEVYGEQHNAAVPRARWHRRGERHRMYGKRRACRHFHRHRRLASTRRSATASAHDN